MQDQERPEPPSSFSPLSSEAEARKVAERVLVIEDDLDAAHTLATVLRGMGHTVQFAVHARAGLEIAERLQPTVVFLAQDLPDMDAFQLARQLRADPQRTPRVVVLAPGGAEEPVAADTASDCDARLLKPLKAAVIEAALAAPRAARPAAPPSDKAS